MRIYTAEGLILYINPTEGVTAFTGAASEPIAGVLSHGEDMTRAEAEARFPALRPAIAEAYDKLAQAAGIVRLNIFRHKDSGDRT